MTGRVRGSYIPPDTVCISPRPKEGLSPFQGPQGSPVECRENRAGCLSCRADNRSKTQRSHGVPQRVPVQAAWPITHKHVSPMWVVYQGLVGMSKKPTIPRRSARKDKPIKIEEIDLDPDAWPKFEDLIRGAGQLRPTPKGGAGTNRPIKKESP